MGRRFFSSTPEDDDDKWKKVRNRFDVLGDCSICGRKKVYGVQTIYGDHSESITCNSCGQSGGFTVHDEDYYDNASKWKPLGNDDEDDNQRGSGRYTRGKRN